VLFIITTAFDDDVKKDPNTTIKAQAHMAINFIIIIIINAGILVSKFSSFG
jgi:hypothetical protein